MKWCALFILLIVMVGGVVYASGTCHLPQNFCIRRITISRADLQYGRELFSGKKLVGEGGKTCATCHDKPEKIDSKSLSKRSDKLPQLINACLTHRERGRGKEVTKSGKEMTALEAWLIYRYRLSAPKR